MIFRCRIPISSFLREKFQCMFFIRNFNPTFLCNIRWKTDIYAAVLWFIDKVQIWITNLFFCRSFYFLFAFYILGY